MKSRLADFEWEHLNDIDLRNFDRMGFEAIPESREQLQIYLDTGLVYTGLVDDDVIMIGGVCVVRPKVGFAWLLTSDLVKTNKVFFHKACSVVIDMGVKEHNLHRLETTIIEGHEISKNWAERIGFEQEGLMRKFDEDGNNYYLYAKVI